MKKSDFLTYIERSKAIRQTYHQLEEQYHESEWTIRRYSGISDRRRVWWVASRWIK